jgi:hypothetical protein
MPLITSGAVSKRICISAEKVSLSARCIAARCSAWQLEGAAHEHRVGRCFEGLGETFALASSFSSRRRRVNTSLMRSSRLVPARSVSVLRAMAKTSSRVRRVISSLRSLLFAFQRVLLFGTQGVGRQPRFLEEPLTFGSCLAPSPCSGARRVAGRTRRSFLELVALLFGFGFFLVGVREFLGDTLLPLIDGVKDGLVQEALHQPDQDEES